MSGLRAVPTVWKRERPPLESRGCSPVGGAAESVTSPLSPAVVQASSAAFGSVSPTTAPRGSLSSTHTSPPYASTSVRRDIRRRPFFHCLVAVAALARWFLLVRDSRAVVGDNDVDTSPSSVSSTSSRRSRNVCKRRGRSGTRSDRIRRLAPAPTGTRPTVTCASGASCMSVGHRYRTGPRATG